LYGESKIGLETLLNRWHSESWSNYLTIVGAVIGWTRGTGLMNDNNLIAEAMEQAGIRTFSSNEMAFNILGLMHPKMVRMAEYAPVYADLNGGLDAVNNLAEFTKEIRSELTNSSNIKRALAKEHALEASLDLQHSDPALKIKPRANLTYAYPELKAKENLPGNPLLKDLLDLNQIVVVTGFSEVGPWGNSRTRWEMEAYGEFSLEGCVEMAWMMGLITFSTANSYTGWVDTKTKEPVADHEIKVRYESQILAHTGIRLIEPELFNGYDPNKKMLMQEVVIDYDMAPIEVSKEEADNFKLQHGAKADILENNNGNWSVRLKRGAVIYVPKALRFDRLVAGQIPTGWSAEKYGIGKDIIAQVDPITLYVLVATVEALISAGVTDPYEFYKYVHVSEVGNTSGGGEGGMLSNRGMFQSRFLDKPIAHDVLQESFINTMPAWVNLLLLSSSGPIKTPVGACATAVESVEIGMETILSGKAQVVIVGGYDDFQEESSYEFANMKATSSAVEEFAKGRQPDEMSRPTATSRAGFMESQGSGIQVLMTAALAIKMGCPIYGIVALTNTATDKEGRSIPAPGQGILTTAKCVRTPSSVKPRTLQMEYRHERIVKALQPIKEWFCDELQNLEEEASQIENETERKEYIAVRSKDIELERERRECQEKRMWGMNFWMHDNRISRIEGALAVFGLTVDDIGVASFHGTSTKANDLNESEVINKQLEHLGRTPGNVLPSIFQKYLTGHPKGAAAAWMLNGVLQVLNTGIIPGNRNADNIDEKLSGFTNLLYLSRTVHTTGIRAAILKSFGFGQVGGEVLVIHPDYLYSTLTTDQYNAYKERRCSRQAKTYRYFQDVLIGSGKLVNVKTEPPYSSDIESKVYLNPVARASFDPKKNSWTFKESEIDEAHKKAICDDSTNSLYTTLNSVIGNINNNNSNESAGVGVDVQLIKDLPLDNDNFIERNFSEVEILYCRNQPDQGSSFAGRWAAKEAVAKAICNAKSGNADFFQWKDGSGGSLKSIEIIPSTIKGGAPEVNLTGDLVKWCNDPSQYEIKASISHSGEYAIAVAIVRKI
jgi:fatty acid synthase subunit beta